MTCRWLLILLSVLMVACSGNPDKPREQTEQQLYQEARAALDKDSNVLAIEKLKALESQYPFGEYAEQAQLELIYVYFKTSDLESALEMAERFIRLHPLHPQIDYAYYIRALTTYEMGFTMVERRLSNDVAQRDPTPLRDAFQYFSELLTRFPDSPYTADARARMVYLRERLASHNIGVARYYMKRHAFIAAANRANKVVSDYPGTTAVADGLVIMTEAYRELSMDKEADRSLALLKYNFPDHSQLQDGEFITSGLAETDRRSWLEIITFGLSK
ncbi:MULTISPECIES: outer membrane protein assembly factor BamD [unclassified Oceanobacter]|uniref:outer membrane protein assembly factor BamD n=1 Tax=unclassified Oceanobacter TaxID=2620260 RepID=UPI00273264D8|nr:MULTISPECIES: outer membrane protein assembly factor BamD [unclassified Oceanobacter]MDP2505216.1 outer membrane protein assembly factor BamD [Oceanobacter sp. 3_MG-2023]MDP2549201.1 outer membrane protein assembly factor BamD [Oceanobacter sp. 4_MG-2023]